MLSVTLPSRTLCNVRYDRHSSPPHLSNQSIALLVGEQPGCPVDFQRMSVGLLPDQELLVIAHLLTIGGWASR